MEAQKEFELTSDDFNFLINLVGERTGIVLHSNKRDMVYSRLTRRLRALDLRKFSDYCQLLESPEGQEELENFTNAITTNTTKFFREEHHFEFLTKIITDIRETMGGQKRIRIWSAGCSAGQEPYTLAMTLLEVFGGSLAGWDVKILATDIDTNILRKAANGVYEGNDREGIPPAYMKYVTVDHSAKSPTYKMNDSLKKLITFKQLNLMGPWPMSGPFDVIFCRNVIIYFSKDTQAMLFDRYAGLLKPNGHFFIGHSESVSNLSKRFKLVGKTVYQKVS